MLGHEALEGGRERRFCKNIDGAHKIVAGGHREAVDRIADDLRRFKTESGVDEVVVLNLASTERWPDLSSATFCNSSTPSSAASTATTRRSARPCSTPTRRSRTAYAYGNFTPSVAADIPALTALAERRNVPVAGKDGKTGQTMMKTVHRAGAPGPRAPRRRLVLDQHPRQPRRPRARRPGFAAVEAEHQGLGAGPDPRLPGRGPHRRHQVLPAARRRQGSLGQHRRHRLPRPAHADQGQLPLQGLDPGGARSSIEIARVLGLAEKRGDGGVQEQLSLFFKAPMARTATARSTPSTSRRTCCSTGSARS